MCTFEVTLPVFNKILQVMANVTRIAIVKMDTFSSHYFKGLYYEPLTVTNNSNAGNDFFINLY